MIHEVTINGKQEPVKFGFSALANFCKLANIPLSKMDRLGEDMTLETAFILIYCGLKDGARVTKKDFTLTVDDIGDLLDDNPELLNDVMSAFSNSQAVPSAKQNKKKVMK